MNILLTGGTGYIGSHTAVVASNAGHRVVLLDNLSNSSAVVVERIGKIVNQQPMLEIVDILDTEAVKNVLRRNAIETVIHFAGLKAVGESVSLPLDYFHNNLSGTISLLQAMSETGVKRLIFSSSATVYGQPQYLPLDESHPTSVTNPYGRTKLHIEEILGDLAVSDPSWRIAILRYFNPVGAHDSGLIGEDPNGVPNNLMPYIARVAAGRLPILNIWGDDYLTLDGTGVRDYIHVMDLAKGHLAALNSLDNTEKPCDIFNLGNGIGISVLQMVTTFMTVTGCSVPYQISARRNGDIAKSWADVSKARQQLGWSATRNLEEMCTTSWRFAQVNNSRFR